jgi:Predicted AAA-ATPase/PD-(D/E)XK nuclease superfamily
MKNLPIGIQTLPKLRDMNCVYVDKTQLVHRLVTTGTYYFFARPRRFGKSLLVSTLKELFKGNRAVFEGLWIEHQWDWNKTHPVIHLSFDAIDYREQSLADALKRTLTDIAESFGLELEKPTLASQFKELLEKLYAKHGGVVLLVDEYDKPIIDYLETEHLDNAKVNRQTLRDFYSIVKSSDEYLRLVFITGISKFAKVSLFSHLNNLDDISLNKNYATLAGYTQTEIETYFEDYIGQTRQDLNLSRVELLEQMKIWYNGYSWDGGESRVYNPFGTLNFFHNREFRNYWFSTGNPHFLIEQMKKHGQFAIENTYADSIDFDIFDIENISLTALLFQTGYLTIKARDVEPGSYILDYPNQEVRQSMYRFLLDDLAHNNYRTNTGRTMLDMNRAFLEGNLDQVRQILASILADLPSQTYLKQTEGLYHGLIHIIFSYLGIFIQSEVHSSQGRADAVVQTPTAVYVFEFKFNQTAQVALAQLRANGYGEPYRAAFGRASGRAIMAIGVNFNAESRSVNEWLTEPL